MNAYEILTGVGTLYMAVANTAAPALNTTPGAAWSELGLTDDGVKIALKQKIETIRTDQHTGPVKAVRTEEDLIVTANLVQATLENLAQALGGQVVTDAAPGAGTIGTRSIGFYRGPTVNEYAFLFRASSPYGDYPAQYYIPRGICGGDAGLEYKKGKAALIPMEFTALEDFNAVNDDERFGVYSAQDAAAT